MLSYRYNQVKQDDFNVYVKGTYEHLIHEKNRENMK